MGSENAFGCTESCIEGDATTSISIDRTTAWIRVKQMGKADHLARPSWCAKHADNDISFRSVCVAG